MVELSLRARLRPLPHQHLVPERSTPIREMKGNIIEALVENDEMPICVGMAGIPPADALLLSS